MDEIKRKENEREKEIEFAKYIFSLIIEENIEKIEELLKSGTIKIDDKYNISFDNRLMGLSLFYKLPMLYMAVYYNKYNVAKYLLENNAKIDLYDDLNLLCVPALDGNKELLDLLVKYGGSLDKKDKYGLSPKECIELNRIIEEKCGKGLDISYQIYG